MCTCLNNYFCFNTSPKIRLRAVQRLWHAVGKKSTHIDAGSIGEITVGFHEMATFPQIIDVACLCCVVWL